MNLLSLRSGRLGLDLAPQAGGSIARFTADGSIDLLRPATPEAVASGRGNNSSCYPLVPFSGRIANGRFVFDGSEIVLKPNWPGVRHPMHGDGWARPWSVARSDGHSADIVYEHDPREGWPFRYRARQTYRLDGDTLTRSASASRTWKTGPCRPAWGCIRSSCAMPMPSSPAAPGRSG